MKTYEELETYRKQHPDARLYACANFDGQVHLTERASRRRLYTWCGLTGDTKEHMLMFQMPLEWVDCQECKEAEAKNERDNL